jgi:hypothetical protein
MRRIPKSLLQVLYLALFSKTFQSIFDAIIMAFLDQAMPAGNLPRCSQADEISEGSGTTVVDNL